MFSGLFQPTHLILILVVVLIVFGPGKLPEAGRAMGKAVRDMRDAFGNEDEGTKEDAKVANSETPGKNTKATNAAASSASETAQTSSVNH